MKLFERCKCDSEKLTALLKELLANQRRLENELFVITALLQTPRPRRQPIKLEVLQ